MRKKKHREEEHPDETWLLPYSDMLTLLLALFIVMFAMASVDKDKFKQISSQFNIIFAGGDGVMEGAGDALMLSDEGSEEVKIATGTANEPLTKGQIEENTMNDIKSKLDAEIAKEGYTGKVNVNLSNEGLEISIQDVVLFNSGEAEVLGNVSPLIAKISNMLADLNNEIKIVGHTDNVPIKNDKYRDNWDLSSMRALNVRNFMVGTGKIKPENVSIQAYGEYRPKVSNDTEEGRAQNRRVEIFIIRQYPVAESATE